MFLDRVTDFVPNSPDCSRITPFSCIPSVLSIGDALAIGIKFPTGVWKLGARNAQVVFYIARLLRPFNEADRIGPFKVLLSSRAQPRATNFFPFFVSEGGHWS